MNGALLFLVGLAVGMVGRDLWLMCVDLFDIWREER